MACACRDAHASPRSRLEHVQFSALQSHARRAESAWRIESIGLDWISISPELTRSTLTESISRRGCCGRTVTRRSRSRNRSEDDCLLLLRNDQRRRQSRWPNAPKAPIWKTRHDRDDDELSREHPASEARSLFCFSLSTLV